ncbi:MAG: peptidyl-prolyl cis-trans isomerase [Ignavibacteriales bacterium]|nr:peptidyl-prolyl cis-trans isomerase [Ignavibacteriales bacterium]
MNTSFLLKSLRLHTGILLLISAFFLLGCAKPQKPRTPVARIDNLTLTLEEIESRFDSSRGLSQAQVHEYIQRWLTSQLLYQEAVRRGLDQTDDLESRLADIRRQLAINALLEEEIFTLKSQTSSEDEISTYFEANRSEFIVSHDVALVSFVIFQDRDAANAFRLKVLRGTPWAVASRELLNDPLQAQATVASVDSVYHTERTIVPTQLWRVAVASPRQEPSFPVRTDEGYIILTVWKFTKRGEVADLPYVTQEIESRLAIARRQLATERLLENLRSQHVVQILVSSVPQDSVSLKMLE